MVGVRDELIEIQTVMAIDCDGYTRFPPTMVCCRAACLDNQTVANHAITGALRDR